MRCGYSILNGKFEANVQFWKSFYVRVIF